MAKNDLLIRIAADISSLDKATRAAVSRIQGMANDLNAVGSRLAIGITAPLAGLAAVSLNAAGELDALRRGLDTVTGSSVETSTQLARLREIAKLPGLAFREAVQGSVNLQAIGFSARGAERVISQFGNAIASVGRGRQDLEEVIRQLGQMASRGKVTADNLKPIIERVPQMAGIIRREFGTVDTEVLQKMGVSSQRFIEVLLGGLEELPRTTGGIKNDFENLKDSIEQASAAIGNALIPVAKRVLDEFIVPMVEGVRKLAEQFQQLPTPVQNAGIAIAGIVAAAGPTLFFLGQMTEAVLALSKAYTALKASALITGALSAGVSAAPWVAATVAAGYYVSKLNETEAAQAAVARSADRQKRMLADASAQLRETGALKTYSTAAKDTMGSLLDFVGAIDKGKNANSLYTDSLKPVADGLAKVSAKAKETSKFFLDSSIASAQMRPSLDQAAAALDRLREQEERAQEAIVEMTNSLPNLSEPLKFVAKEFDMLADSAERAANSIQQGLEQFEKEHTINLSPEIKDAQMRTGIDEAARQIERDSKQIETTTTRMGRQVSLVLNDVARDITDLAFKGGKLKDVMVSTFENIGKALLRSAIESQLKRIVGMVTDLISKVPGLSKVAGAVFGGGASAASGAASAAGGAASGAGSAAGGAASAASGGLLGIIGVGAQVASAVSSIVGNFQMAGMNKSLDLIVNHTLRTANQLIEGLQPQVNRYLPYLEMIHQRMVEQIAAGGGLAAAGAGGPVTIQFYGSNGDYEKFMRELKQRGVIK